MALRYRVLGAATGAGCGWVFGLSKLAEIRSMPMLASAITMAGLSEQLLVLVLVGAFAAAGFKLAGSKVGLLFVVSAFGIAVYEELFLPDGAKQLVTWYFQVYVVGSLLVTAGWFWSKAPVPSPGIPMLGRW